MGKEITRKQFDDTDTTELISSYDELLTRIDELADTNRKFLFFKDQDMYNYEVDYDLYSDAYEYIDTYFSHLYFRNAFEKDYRVKQSVEANLQANYLVNHLSGTEYDERLVEIYKEYFSSYQTFWKNKFFQTIIKVAYPEYYNRVYRYRWRYNRGIYSPYRSRPEKHKEEIELPSIRNVSTKQIYDSYNEYKKHMEE